MTLPSQARQYNLNKVGRGQDGPEPDAQTTEEGKVEELGAKGAEAGTRSRGHLCSLQLYCLGESLRRTSGVPLEH